MERGDWRTQRYVDGHATFHSIWLYVSRERGDKSEENGRTWAENERVELIYVRFSLRGRTEKRKLFNRVLK